VTQWNCPATKDPETGDVYIRLGGSPDGIPGEAAVQRTLEAPDLEMDVVLDFDSAGRLIGIEILAGPDVVQPAAGASESAEG